MSDSRKHKPVKSCYPKGKCPDCNETIPHSAVEGDSCKNCGHVFYYEHDDDSP